MYKLLHRRLDVTYVIKIFSSFPQNIPSSIALMETYSTKHEAVHSVVFSVTGVRTKKEVIHQEDKVAWKR